MHMFVVKKATIIRAAVFALLVIGVIIYTQTAIGGAAPVISQAQAMPICRVETDKMIVALTFDTAFGEKDYTEEILAELKKESTRATFCVMGLWATENGPAVDDIMRDGHEIVSHSMYHERYPDITQNEIIEDADEAASLIFEKTGYDTRIIRLPYGAFDTPAILSLEGEGYIPIKWSLDSKDWKGYDAQKLAQDVLFEVKSGDIIMFQNNMDQTPKALAAIILGLRERGFKIVSLSELLIDDNYIVDDKGTQRYIQN
ncbi:MAG: polysaccharide deacetylase family protein [Christensenellales bacterium]